MEEKKLTEKESLEIITSMIHKAKSSFHETGTSAILWGAVIGSCGLFSFAERQWNFSAPFDVFWLTLAAIIPQIILSRREKKRMLAKTHQQAATDVVWNVYAISIIAVVIYGLIVPGVYDRFFEERGVQLMSKDLKTGELTAWHTILPSMSSIYLIIYAFPTLATGLINNFKAMTWGAILCYGFFLISLYTPYKIDLLLHGLAGIFNWLIPGLLLRQRYLKGKPC